jgi:D-serine deaminase-like pyridoxal phosphate-dependent protein
MTLSLTDPAMRDIPTPALIVDRAALEGNIRSMADTAKRAGIALRPHSKTHKSKEIAALQLEAGAIGIACATVAEAEALAHIGIPGILITSPVVGSTKPARVSELNRSADICVVVDHVAHVDRLVEALQPGDRRLRIVIDVDVGQARTGITHLGAGVGLAKSIAANRQLEFAGVQGYAGHVQHIVDPHERKVAAAKAAEVLRTFTEALRSAGLAPKLISGSGTGAHALDLAGPYNELQVGSYIFMDSDYARILDERGTPLSFSPSLFVLATVVSANRAAQVTVDAGTKSLATNGPPPCLIIGAPGGSTYRFGGDEHGIIDIPAGQRAPELGSRVLIGATHCDPTVNLHSSYRVISQTDLEEWPILGRY